LTLCEALLVVEARRKRVLIPDKKREGELMMINFKTAHEQRQQTIATYSFVMMNVSTLVLSFWAIFGRHIEQGILHLWYLHSPLNWQSVVHSRVLW